MIVLLGAWMLLSLLITYGTALYRWRVRRPIAPEPAGPAVLLLVPVKGGGAGLERFLQAVDAQTDVVHRVVFAVESTADPAYAQLRDRMSPFEVVVAGIAARGSQKVHNLLAGLACVRPEDAVVVFADADSEPPGDWLAQLIRPVLRGRADICSGYLWMVPQDRRLGSVLGAAISVTVATMPRFSEVVLCWGGSTAVGREALARLDLPALWQGVLLDDLVLTRAARRLGLRLHASHFVLVPTQVSYSLAALCEYGRRQYFHIRIHAMRHWLLAAVVLGLPVVAALAGLRAVLSGNLTVLACYAVAIAMQSVRWRLRKSIARRLLAERFWPVSVPPLWLRPVVCCAHLALFVSSAFGNVIVWGGTRYRVNGPHKVEILR